MSDWIPLVFLVGLFALTILMIEGANAMRGRQEMSALLVAAGVVSLGLFAYLMVALLFPEKLQ